LHDALPISKLATADRIYAGGRLVEKQKAWFMKCGAGQGNPLLEASRQRSGQLSAPLDQTVFSQGPSDARPACRSRKPIHPSVEFEVLFYRQVFVQAEALGHVADALLDAFRFAYDIEPHDEAAPRA